MIRPRFLADHDLNEHIVMGVVRLHPEIEFVRVRDVGLADSSDLDVLAYALRMSFCVVSHDVNTMTAAAAATIKAGSSSSPAVTVAAGRQRAGSWPCCRSASVTAVVIPPEMRLCCVMSLMPDADAAVLPIMT